MLHCELTFLAFTSTETFCLFGEIEVLSAGVQIGNVTTELSHFSDIDLVMELGWLTKFLKKPICSIRARVLMLNFFIKYKILVP
jgi:hypothetical protein